MPSVDARGKQPKFKLRHYRPTGVLDDAIKAAVHDALCELMPLQMKPLAVEVARELRAASGFGEASFTTMPTHERFVSMTELCTRLGINRTTAHRRTFGPALTNAPLVGGIFGLIGFEIAVGTVVTHRPPHRSGLAGFPHPAPTLSV